MRVILVLMFRTRLHDPRFVVGFGIPTLTLAVWDQRVTTEPAFLAQLRSKRRWLLAACTVLLVMAMPYSPAPKGRIPALEPGEATAALEVLDDARDLLGALQREDFGPPEDLMTGRFLAEIPAKIHFVREIDPDRLRMLGHGSGWARLEAPGCASTEAEEAAAAILDIVWEDTCWKLEALDLQI